MFLFIARIKVNLFFISCAIWVALHFFLFSNCCIVVVNLECNEFNSQIEIKQSKEKKRKRCSFCHWYVPCGKIIYCVFFPVCVSLLFFLFRFRFLACLHTGWKVKYTVFGCCRHIYLWVKRTHSKSLYKSFFYPLGLICHRSFHIFKTRFVIICVFLVLKFFIFVINWFSFSYDCLLLLHNFVCAWRYKKKKQQ